MMRKVCLRRVTERVAVALTPALLVLASGCSTQHTTQQFSATTDTTIRVALPDGPVFDDAVMGDPQLAAQLTPPDLTEPGSWATGTATPTIIDTRTFKTQIQPVEFEGEPKAVKNLLPPHHRDKKTEQGAPNNLVAGNVTDQITTTPGTFFPGIDQTPWSPPDPTLAVGPNHIVATVNMDIAWWDKNGNLQFRSRMDSTGNPGFFEDIGAGNFTFDPKCFYDAQSGRFFVLALEVYGSNQAWITIAVSDDSDPNGIWYKYRTDARIQVGSSQYWVDYPGLGFDSNAMYVNGNLFRLNGGGGGFAGVIYRSFDKSKLIAGLPAVYTDIRDGNGASAQAAQCFGNNPTPYFVEVNNTSSISLIAIRNPLTSPSLVKKNVSVPSFSYPSGGAPNHGGSVDVLDGRMINAMWRDGSLVAGHGVRIGGKNQSRWYEFATNGWPDSGNNPTLTQSGNIDGGSGVHTWYPALYINEAGAIGLVTAASSSSTFASVQYTGRAPTDPAGTMGALSVAHTGNQAANGRWGDYFDMALDPDGQTFWFVGEYYQGGGWGTEISSFNVNVQCIADCNQDGNVDTQDFICFLNLFTQLDPQADCNGDTIVNTLDFTCFLNAWNAGCP